MINLDELYEDDVRTIDKAFIAVNATNDETFNALIYFVKIKSGIIFFNQPKKANALPILDYLAKYNIRDEFYLECINLLPSFHAIHHHQVKISLLRTYYLVHSNLDLSALATVDILTLSKLPLADFKAFVTASNEVKH